MAGVTSGHTKGTARSILICGAGPVGLTAALELARRGIRARILDEAAGPTPLEESPCRRSRSWMLMLRDLGVPLVLKAPPVRDRLLRGVLGVDTPPPPWFKAPAGTACGVSGAQR